MESGALTPATKKLSRQAQVKGRFVETSFDPNSNVSVSVTQKDKEEWEGLQSKQLGYLATGQNLPHYRG